MAAWLGDCDAVVEGERVSVCVCDLLCVCVPERVPESERVCVCVALCDRVRVPEVVWLAVTLCVGDEDTAQTALYPRRRTPR